MQVNHALVAREFLALQICLLTLFAKFLNFTVFKRRFMYKNAVCNGEQEKLFIICARMVRKKSFTLLSIGSRGGGGF